METADAKRRRGRPRSFDEDRVLAAVLDRFWTKGYAAASLDDLAAAAGVNRPSLYAALGDKRAMYLRAVERFAAQMDGQLRVALVPDRPLEQGLLDFYTAGIDLYTSGDVPRGCLLLCTAATEAPSDPAVRHALAAALGRMDAAFEQRIAAEARAPGSADRAAALARLASAVVHSLAVRARAGEPRASLMPLAEAGARLLANASASGEPVSSPLGPAG